MRYSAKFQCVFKHGYEKYFFKASSLRFMAQINQGYKLDFQENRVEIN